MALRPDVGRLEQHAARQLPLHRQRVLHRVPGLQVGVDRLDVVAGRIGTRLREGRRSRIGELPLVVPRGLPVEGRVVADVVALGGVRTVEDAEAGADRRLAVELVGEPDPRGEVGPVRVHDVA